MCVVHSCLHFFSSLLCLCSLRNAFLYTVCPESKKRKEGPNGVHPSKSEPPSVPPGLLLYNNNNGGKASSAVPAAALPQSQQQQLKGAYPNPSNFAERLLHVLDNEIAQDALWWLGDGEAIAIHPEHLQASAVFERHFQGNRYTSFIRNLNGW